MQLGDARSIKLWSITAEMPEYLQIANTQRNSTELHKDDEQREHFVLTKMEMRFNNYQMFPHSQLIRNI